MDGQKQVKIRVNPEIAKAFAACCKNAGTSVTKELSAFMGAASGSKTNISSDFVKFPAGTRKDRRKTVGKTILILSAVREAESRYMENIPENMHGGLSYEKSEESIDSLDQAIALLEEAF